MDIVKGKDAPAPGPEWVKLPQDLNKGVDHSEYLYLCYTRDKMYGSPITDVIAIAGPTGSNISPPAGYTKISEDTNQGAFSKNSVYICYAKEDGGCPITDLAVKMGDNKCVQCDHGYFRINQDLNSGSGSTSKYIYVCCKK